MKRVLGLSAVLDRVDQRSDRIQKLHVGTNYPKGPIAWGAEIGFDVIATLLRQLDVAFPAAAIG